jgi:hypothetical protein
MILQVGPVTRPNNEAVVVPSYTPIYDYLRRIEAMKIRWEITGRVVNYPVATQAITSTQIRDLEVAFRTTNPRCALLGDDRSPTPYLLDPGQLMQGPYLIDYSFPTSEAEVYATGLAYRVSLEGIQYVGNGGSNDLISFTEELTETPGGTTFVYVGGAVNYAERQTAFQKQTYKYVQSGSATGLLARPAIPPPIWPFALMSEPRKVLGGPLNQGRVDTDFTISWEYNFEWHTKLYGVPHKNNLG